MDATAIGQIYERDTRKESDRIATCYCHSLRILQDLIGIALIRNEFILDHIDGVTDYIPNNVIDVYRKINDEYIIANQHFKAEQK